MNSPFVQPSVPKSGRQTVIAVAGIVALGLVFELLRRLANLKLYVVETIALCLAGGIVYLILLYFFEHSPDDRATLWLILAGAVLFRLLLVSLPPTLSDDVYRYLWDARVQHHGYNPYSLRPDDPLLAHLRDENYLRVAGRDIPTVYTPLLQLLFRAAYYLVKVPVGFKFPFLLAEFLLMVLLARWLQDSGGRNHILALYAWNPLVIVEFSASGHYDSLVLLCVFAACLFIAQRREALSIFLLAAGALIKAYPVLLLPLWIRRAAQARHKRAWLGVATSLALAIVCVSPYWKAWRVFLASMNYYESSWLNNNASLASLLDWFSGNHEITVALGAGICVGLALWAAARRMDTARAGYLIVGAILLLSPNSFAWYFTWMIPFLCFFPNPAWLMLTVLQFLSYHVLIDYQASGNWQFQPYFLWLTYVPFFAHLVFRPLLFGKEGGFSKAL